MFVPWIVGLDEIAQILRISKSRVSQLAERRTFPEHYIRLRVGRIWLTKDILNWANETGRPINLDIDQTDGKATYERGAKPQWAFESEYRESYVGSGEALPPTVERSEASVVTIPPEGGPQSAELDNDDNQKDFVPGPAQPDKPARRDSAQLNQEALRADFDRLVALNAAAVKGDDAALNDRELIPFAVMFVAVEASVPNYRKTKAAMTKAWLAVRRAHGTTVAEEIALAKYVVENANTPFTPGAVKRFSENEIAKMRRGQSKPASIEEFVKNAPPGTVHRWQGGRYGQHEAINATLTPEERKRYGVQE